MSRKSVDTKKACWVCFANEEDDPSSQWTRPCRCKGTTMWVHQACLQRWIDEKQSGNSTATVSCPQCSTEYVIVLPKMAKFVYMLDMMDGVVYKLCPFAAAGIFVGSVYWIAVTYGALTVMQVLGHKQGLDVMERADALFLFLGLPTIPAALILSKMVHWEDYVLNLCRKYSDQIRLLNYVFPGTSQLARVPAAVANNAHRLHDPISFTRVLCSATIFPTIATFVGKLLFSRLNSNFQRTVLGGIVFVVIKGILKIYYKQQQYLRQAQRQVQDYAGQQEGRENDDQLESTSS